MRFRFLPAVTGLAAMLALAACSDNKLGGDIDVNGQKSPVTSCRSSLQGDNGFAEISTAAGYRIRITQNKVPTSPGSTTTKTENAVFLQPPGAPQPVLARCKSTSTSNKTINGRMSGSATLAGCTGAGGNVSATITYGGCGN